MCEAWSEIPVMVARNLENAILISVVAGGLRCSKKTIVEGCESPLNVVAAFRVLQLPIGDLFHRLQDCWAFKVGRQIGFKRPRIVGLIAGRCAFIDDWWSGILRKRRSRD